MRRVYDPAMPVVTISASYGSGGSEVAPALAERLGVRFVDRVVSPETAHRLAQAENAGLFWRLIRSISPAGGLTAGSIHAERELHDRFSDREALESALRDAAAVGDVVILGRAGALALREHPGALHVRLDGPVEARIRQGMAVEGVDRETAERHIEETDKARRAYVNHFYRCDPREASLYHLVIDSTAIPLGACAELIVGAARARERGTAPANA